MKLVLNTLIIFFGTLLVAGVVALGEPTEASASPSAGVPHTGSLLPPR